MSLGNALSVAASGMRATQLWADVTSRNIANATTEGYVRKETHFQTSMGTVEVSAIQREVNMMLDRLDRGETAKLARQAAVRDGIDAYTSMIGTPDDMSSVSVRMNEFRQSLQALSSKPGDAALQASVVDQAKRLTGSLRESDATLDTVRSEAVLNIEYDVSDANDLLRDISRLNGTMERFDPGSLALAETQDKMDKLIDKLSGFMDIQILRSSSGRVDLYTGSGTALIEGETVHKLSFDKSTDTLRAGAIDITPGSSSARGFSQGSLAGLFDLKTDIIPRIQLQLDEASRMLIEGFTAADPSLGAGAAGLFTDAGNPYDPAALTGLAGRLRINDAVNPETGGALFRIRDGIGAAAPGPAGSSAQITRFLDVFNAAQTVAPGAGLGASLTLQDYTDSMIARQQTERTNAEHEYETISIAATSISAARQNGSGVNTDSELQRLMMIEQSYGANAKMMTAVSDMFDALLRAV